MVLLSNYSDLRRWCLVLPIALCLSGCGVVWDDEKGFRHALGIGYLTWPSIKGSDPPTVTGVDTYGMAILVTRAATGVTIGMTRERYVGLGNNQFIALDCLECDLATSRPRGGGV